MDNFPWSWQLAYPAGVRWRNLERTILRVDWFAGCDSGVVMAGKIESLIQEKFGYEKVVCVRNGPVYI